MKNADLTGESSEPSTLDLVLPPEGFTTPPQEEDLCEKLYALAQHADAVFQKIDGLKEDYIQTLIQIEHLENRIRAQHGVPACTPNVHQMAFQATMHEHRQLPKPRIHLS